MDIGSLTTTAQAIADLHINSAVTVVLVAIIAVINALSVLMKIFKK